MERAVAWDGCLNVRDLGGLPLRGGGATRPGVVIRSDDLARLTATGRRQFDDRGVRCVLDLRSTGEVEGWPSPFAGTDVYEHTPLWNDAMDAAGDLSLSEVYHGMTVRLRPELRLVFERLAAGVRRGPAVMHCFSGKDRTGLASGLLLDACGVDRAAIAEDYALSGVCLKELFDSWVAEADPSDRAGLAAGLAADPELLLDVFGRLDAEWGGTTAFLLGCGVSSSALERLQTALAP